MVNVKIDEAQKCGARDPLCVCNKVITAFIIYAEETKGSSLSQIYDLTGFSVISTLLLQNSPTYACAKIATTYYTYLLPLERLFFLQSKKRVHMHESYPRLVSADNIAPIIQLVEHERPKLHSGAKTSKKIQGSPISKNLFNLLRTPVPPCMGLTGRTYVNEYI